MRQVPHYLIIGDGRVSRHFQHYFSLLKLSYSIWSRKHPVEQLLQKLPLATHVLLLINDDSIEHFCESHLKNLSIPVIHFSGSLVTPLAYGTHPLMTFNQTLYTLDHYQSIPFVIDHNAPDFEALLPGIPNSHVRLHTDLKPKYHALCVLSGNFSCILWQKLFSSLENEFNIPASIAYPYLKQQTQNLLDNYTSALTGPLVRNDQKTLDNNMEALSHDPFRGIYEQFRFLQKEIK